MVGPASTPAEYGANHSDFCAEKNLNALKKNDVVDDPLSTGLYCPPRKPVIKVCMLFGGHQQGSTMNVMHDEQAYLLRWQGGDRAAGDAVLRHYAPMLARFFARRVSGNVEELVQRTLFACAQGIKHFEHRSNFRSYLFGIAHNQFLMSIRAQAKERRQDPLPAVAAPTETPSQALAVKQEHRHLLEVLMHVSEQFRDVLTLFYWHGLSVEEISDRLSIPVGTVKSRLARGRSSVRAGMLNRTSQPPWDYPSDTPPQQ